MSIASDRYPKFQDVKVSAISEMYKGFRCQLTCIVFGYPLL
jgi:hypothetical protein